MLRYYTRFASPTTVYLEDYSSPSRFATSIFFDRNGSAARKKNEKNKQTKPHLLFDKLIYLDFEDVGQIYSASEASKARSA